MEVSKLYPQYNQQTDRRKDNNPVNIVQSFSIERRETSRISIDQKINHDINKTKDLFAVFRNNSEKFINTVNYYDSTSRNPHQQFTNKEKLALLALSPIVPVRRIYSLPNNIEDGNYGRALGLAGLMIINLPEDGRDLRDGTQQLLSRILPKNIKKFIQKQSPEIFEKYVNYAPSYDYKEFQPAFSFIRGTFLEKPINKMGKIGIKIHVSDKSIFSTKIGEKISKYLKIDVDKVTKTGRKVPKVAIDLNGSIVIGNSPIYAYKLKGNIISKLIGWGMLRMTTMGVAAIALLEIPKILKVLNKNDNIKDKAENTLKQTIKSIINIVSICSGIGIIGGIFARKGHAYSLLGMGIGSVVGAFVSNRTGKFIDKYWNTTK